jgi:hypothetical protein
MEGRAPDLRHLFIPMMTGMLAVCDNYSDAELTLIVGFMHRCGEMTEMRTQALREATLLGSPEAAHPSDPPAASAGESPQKSGQTSTAGARRR